MNLFKWYLLIVFEYWTTFVIERASHATWLVAVMSQTNHESNNNTSWGPIQKRCWSKPDDISTEFLALFSFIPYKTRLSCCFSYLNFVFKLVFLLIVRSNSAAYTMCNEEQLIRPLKTNWIIGKGTGKTHLLTSSSRIIASIYDLICQIKSTSR